MNLYYSNGNNSNIFFKIPKSVLNYKIDLFKNDNIKILQDFTKLTVYAKKFTVV